MSVLEKIESGEIIVGISYLGPLVPDTYKGHRNELLRLAKLGAEAEKASKACNICGIKNKELEINLCSFSEVCKMVREGQDATKY